MKLCELPCSTRPLEILVTYMVREGVLGTLRVESLVRALDLLMEGKVWVEIG